MEGREFMYRVGDMQYTESVLDEMCRADLIQLKNIIDDEIASIKEQLDEAKTEQLVTGTYADPGWWRKANSALRMKGRFVQKIQRQIGLAKQDEHQQSSVTFERHFISVAREVLDKETYSAIIEKAQSLSAVD